MSDNDSKIIGEEKEIKDFHRYEEEVDVDSDYLEDDEIEDERLEDEN